MSGPRPIVHVGEVAGVAGLLREGLERRGLTTAGFVPPAPAPDANDVAKALTLPYRLVASRRGVSRLDPCLVHVHYATTAVWYADRHPLVVHCHGTDVRGAEGVRRHVLSHVFARSELVLVSTPDLLSWTPEGARYLPNPVDTALFHPHAAVDPTSEGDVLLFAAATEVKGVDRLVGIATELLRRRPALVVTAIDMGPGASRLADVGVRLVPRRAPEELPALLAGHRVVVGQQRLTALGTAELQAMACGRPVVGVADHTLYPDPPPSLSPGTVADCAVAVSDLLGDASAAASLGAASREWTERVHSVDAVAGVLAGWYEELGVPLRAGG